MGIQILSSASSLNPGSDLWVMPHIKQSHSSQKLDWYLNFQLRRMAPYQAPKLAEPLVDIVSQCELPVSTNFIESQSPLMIASTQFLPNKWTVMLPNELSDLRSWTHQAYLVWTNLKNPSLRVFLPPKELTTNFQDLWSSFSNFKDFTVVSDV